MVCLNTDSCLLADCSAVSPKARVFIETSALLAAADGNIGAAESI